MATRQSGSVTPASVKPAGVKPARLKDVASLADVSVTAVSRYMNGGLLLPPATASRIDGAVRALDYRPNQMARSLSLGRTETIGLVVPEISNPFFAHLAAAVEDAAAEMGMGLLLCATLNRLDRELDYLKRLQAHQVDGLIFLTNHGDDGTLSRQIGAAQKIVLIDEDVVGTAVPKLFCDNVQGGELAGRHLLEAGHRRIGYLGGPPGLMSSEERLLGLRRSLAGTEGAEVCWIASGLHTPEQGEAAALQWLACTPRPSAIFIGSGALLIGFLGGIAAAGLRVPDDVSIIAFDDIGPLHLFQPPITAIRQPIQALGQQGVALLRGLLRGDATGPALRLPVELVVRQSVAAPATFKRSRQVRQ